MTTTMSTSRARLFSDLAADPGLFSRGSPGGYQHNGQQPREQQSSSGVHGSKCFCCPYGYHIDLDFVRYCENWQALASNRIAQGNEEKRRRRAHRKQCHSMEFLLGLPDDNEKSKSTLAPTTKPAPPKPPPKPNLESIKLNKDWQDSLSNFEETLSQSYNGPSGSICSTPVANNSFFSEAAKWPRYSASPEPRLASQSNGRGSDEDSDEDVEEEEEEARPGQVEQELPSLHLIREQMAGALERCRQLEEQLKEIPLLHVQMSVLREERRILLRQLASHKRLGLNNQQQQQQPARPASRDASTTCAVLTREVGLSPLLQLAKTRERGTSTEPAEVQSTRARLTKGTQCFGARLAALTSTKSTQCDAAVRAASSDAHTQCEPPAPAPPSDTRTADKATWCGILEQPAKLPEPPLTRSRYVQATEPQPWSKLKLSVGVTAKPSVEEVATETQDASLSLMALRRQELLRRQPSCKSVGTNVERSELVGSVSRATQEQRSRADSATSPQPPARTSDAAVGPDLPSSPSTNYCDECKQTQTRQTGGGHQPSRIPQLTSLGRPGLIRHDTWTGSLDQLGKESAGGDKHGNRALAGGGQPKKTPAATAASAGAAAAAKQDRSNCESSDEEDRKRLEESEKEAAAGRKNEPSAAAMDSASSADKTSELEDDALAESFVLETPKMSSQRPPMELSREMKAALKVLDDNLRKVSSGGTLPSRVKNASNIVQHEWFKVSSTQGANPHGVEFYLDQFEQQSAGLLDHVVNLTDSSGNTAMHYAVSHANFDVVSILIDSKVCDVNKPNNAGYTPVMLAALAQLRNSTHAQVVKRLFHIADVNVRAKLHGQTALMLSVSHGRRDMTRLLLEAGAAVNVQDEDGSTALMCAAEHGHVDIVKLLLSQPDCDSSVVDVDGSSALKIALEAGHADIGVLLYAHQRASSRQPVPHSPRPSKRPSRQPSRCSSTLSMSAPASPVAPAHRRFHSSSLSLADTSTSPKYSL